MVNRYQATQRDKQVIRRDLFQASGTALFMAVLAAFPVLLMLRESSFQPCYAYGHMVGVALGTTILLFGAVLSPLQLGSWLGAAPEKGAYYEATMGQLIRRHRVPAALTAAAMGLMTLGFVYGGGAGSSLDALWNQCLVAGPGPLLMVMALSALATFFFLTGCEYLNVHWRLR